MNEKRAVMMENYRFTAFGDEGETLFNEVWTFENDEQAKQEGHKLVEEKGVINKAHRLINAKGKILIYHV